jgi:drug/metabolite transporter (DMT)-like permease
MQNQPHTWTMVQMAMVISFLAGVLVWKEPAQWMQYTGIAAVMATLLLCAAGGKAEAGPPEERTPGRWLGYVLAALVLTGVAQVLFIVPSRWNLDVPSGLRPVVLLATGAVCAGGLALVRRVRFQRAMLGPALLLACCSVLGLLFTVRSGDFLAIHHLAGLVYPISTGATVVLFALVSRFGLREPFHASTWAGMALGVLGIVLLSTH